MHQLAELMMEEQAGKKPEKNFSGQALATSVAESSQSALTCRFCGKSHATRKCHRFKNDIVQNRWEFAKEKKLCDCCLEAFKF